MWFVGEEQSTKGPTHNEGPSIKPRLNGQFSHFMTNIILERRLRLRKKLVSRM